MKRFLLSIALSGLALSAAADAPAGYYDSLQGKRGADLKAAVKALCAKNRSVPSYGDATWKAFLSTDVRTVNGKQCWWDMYSSNNVAISGHEDMNIEHSVANSWWGHTKNDAYKDIVHLNPSDATANNRKSNFPLAELSTVTWDNGITFVGKPKSGQGGGCSNGYEPNDMYKGDFARAFMYMFTAYDNIAWESQYQWMYDITGGKAEFQKWAVDLLLRWSAKDPVSQKERDRNDGIQKEQKNRNPFIDLPDLADFIWGSRQADPYQVDGTHDPADPADPVNPDPADPVEGTWTLCTDASRLEAGAKYVIAGQKSHITMSCNAAGSYMADAAEATVSDNAIANLPAGTAVISLRPAAGGYVLAVADASGAAKGELSVSDVKKVALAASGSVADISIASDGTATIDYGSYGQLVRNQTSPRFTTYATTGPYREEVQLYRLIEKEDPEPAIELGIPSFFCIDAEGSELTDGSTFAHSALLELKYDGQHSDASFFYTLDGSEPSLDADAAAPATAATKPYTAPLEIFDTVTVKAVGAKKGAVSPTLSLTLTKRPTSGIDSPASEPIAEVWGRNILVTEGSRIFSLNGAEVKGEGLEPGLYIVVAPGCSRPVKVMVR